MSGRDLQARYETLGHVGRAGPSLIFLKYFFVFFLNELELAAWTASFARIYASLLPLMPQWNAT